MAGSYNHLLPEPESEECSGGWSLIENMGDAHECVEELFWLVERAIGRSVALKLLEDEFYPMVRCEMPEDEALRFVRRQLSS